MHKHEIAISNNLDQIEFEILQHRNIVGNSIWEIGRRLNHVKEKDLVHGQFGKWVEEKLNISHRTANQFMAVASKIPYSQTSANLGVNALEIIAALPYENQVQELEKAKEGEPSSVRELKLLRKELNQKDKEIEQLKNRKPKIIEKTVEVEKQIHPHVDNILADNKQLSTALKQAQADADAERKRAESIENQLNKLYADRAEVDDKSTKYDQISEAIKNAEGKLNNTQKLVSDHRDILKILKQGNETILAISGLTFLDISDTVNSSVLISREFDTLINSLERLVRDLRNTRNQTVIEGEFTND